MSQRAQPTADVTVGAWVPVPVFAQVNDPHPGDATFVSSDGSPCGDTFEVKLAEVGVPGSGEHRLKLRLRQVGVGYLSVAVALIQGTTVIASRLIPQSQLTGAFADWDFVLTEGELASITDYADLRVRVTVSQPSSSCSSTSGGSGGSERSVSSASASAGRSSGSVSASRSSSASRSASASGSSVSGSPSASRSGSSASASGSRSLGPSSASASRVASASSSRTPSASTSRGQSSGSGYPPPTCCPNLPDGPLYAAVSAPGCPLDGTTVMLTRVGQNLWQFSSGSPTCPLNITLSCVGTNWGLGFGWGELAACVFDDPCNTPVTFSCDPFFVQVSVKCRWFDGDGVQLCCDTCATILVTP